MKAKALSRLARIEARPAPFKAIDMEAVRGKIAAFVEVNGGRRANESLVEALGRTVGASNRHLRDAMRAAAQGDRGPWLAIVAPPRTMGGASQ